MARGQPLAAKRHELECRYRCSACWSEEPGLERVLAPERAMTAARDHVVSGLIEKRRELAGIIDELQRQLDQHRADLTHIDGVLRGSRSGSTPGDDPTEARLPAQSVFRPQRTVTALPWRAQNYSGRAAERG